MQTCGKDHWQKGGEKARNAGRENRRQRRGQPRLTALSLDTDESCSGMMCSVFVRGEVNVWRLVQLEQVSSIIVLIEHLLDGRLRKVAHLKYHTHTHMRQFPD